MFNLYWSQFPIKDKLADGIYNIIDDRDVNKTKPFYKIKYKGQIFAHYTQVSIKDGRFHSYDDKPSLISINGTKTWHRNGKKHRENGPAITNSNGDEFWFKNGLNHRKDGPAIIWIEDGIVNHTWYLNGKCHRIKGPAHIRYKDGEIILQKWWRYDKLHRVDGPAIISKTNGSEEWYLNDKLHRLDGPAVIGINGVRKWYRGGALHREDGPAWIDVLNEQWFINGNNITFGLGNWLTENNLSFHYSEWNENTWIMFRLKFV